MIELNTNTPDRMTNRTILFRFVVVLLLALAFALTAKPASATEVECYEDEPCWDCETMGNQICGNELNADDTERCVVYIRLPDGTEEIYTPAIWDPACSESAQAAFDEALIESGHDPDITGIVSPEMDNDRPISGATVEQIQSSPSIPEPVKAEIVELVSNWRAMVR